METAAERYNEMFENQGRELTLREERKGKRSCWRRLRFRQGVVTKRVDREVGRGGDLKVKGGRNI